MKYLGLAAWAVLAVGCGAVAGGSGATGPTADSGSDLGLAQDATAVGDDATADAASSDVVASDGGLDFGQAPDVIAPGDADPDGPGPTDSATDGDTPAPSDTQALDDAAPGDGAADTAVTPDVAADVKPPCSPASCDDKDPCTDDGCNAAGACVHGPKPGCGNTPVPCNQPADCAKGSCDPALHVCIACAKTADCAGAGLCLGGKCVPATACSSDGQCKASNQVCDKGVGFCVDCLTAGDCKPSEACVDNHCAPPAAKCASSKDCAGALVCEKNQGICVGCVTSADCPTGETCQANTCKPKTCTAAICVGDKVWNCNIDGTGYTAQPSSCDDGLPCTTDVCAPGTGCEHANNALPCSDGNPCTDNDTCAGGKCAAGGAKNCDDGSICTDDSCSVTLGCVHAINATVACDDGSSCTANDSCKNGVCSGQATISCDDGNGCTVDACDKAGCTHTAAVGPCEDGNACSMGDLCVATVCTAGTAAACDDGNECTSDACAATTGCSHTAKPGCTPVSLPPCATLTDCTGGTVCNVANHTCVGCVKNSDCGGTGVCQGLVCKPAVACVSDVQCKASKQVCNTAAKVCVDCNSKTDCLSGQECQSNTCVSVKACASSKDCAKVCNLQSGVCVDCLGNADCSEAQFCGPDHVCHADVCAGATCNGLNLWSCSADGSGYTSAISCNDGVVCTADACAAKVCSHIGKLDPTAFELPANGLDDNCDGKTDDVPACDSGLGSAVDADYAKALDLCSGISDFPALASPKARAIRGKFGGTFAPQSGSNLVMLSTGVAAAPTEAGYAAPQSGTDLGAAATSALPLGKCAATGLKAQDGSALRVKVLVPANAASMAFDYALFSAEYPEYIGQSFADAFTVTVSGLAYSGDAIGDAIGKCYNTTNATFTTCEGCAKGSAGLVGTGYENGVGGGYGWASVGFAVKPGDTVTVQFAVFDVADGVYDTAVLIDNLRFSNVTVSKPTLIAK